MNNCINKTIYLQKKLEKKLLQFYGYNAGMFDKIYIY